MYEFYHWELLIGKQIYKLDLIISVKSDMIGKYINKNIFVLMLTQEAPCWQLSRGSLNMNLKIKWMIKRYQYKYRESDTTLDLVYLEGNPPANTSLSYTCKCIQYVQVSFSIFFLKIQYPRPLRVVVIIMYMCLLIDFTSTYI